MRVCLKFLGVLNIGFGHLGVGMRVLSLQVKFLAAINGSSKALVSQVFVDEDGDVTAQKSHQR